MGGFIIVYLYFSGSLGYSDRIPFLVLGVVSGVASFITIDEQLQQNRSCYSPMQAMLLKVFPFFRLFLPLPNTYYHRVRRLL